MCGVLSFYLDGPEPPKVQIAYAEIDEKEN